MSINTKPEDFFQCGSIDGCGYGCGDNVQFEFSFRDYGQGIGIQFNFETTGKGSGDFSEDLSGGTAGMGRGLSCGKGDRYDWFCGSDH